MDRIFGFLKSFGSGRMMAILGIAIGVAVTLAFTVLRTGSAQMDLLFANVDPKEAGEIIGALDQAGISYRQEGDGSVINVERGKVIEARNLIAQRGLLTSGSIGYEIFDESNTFGQTQFTQDINRLRALQGELERTIKGLNGVTDARVLLNLPEPQPFQDDTEPPTASVRVGFSRPPSAVEVAGVQNLVAYAVQGLRPERVVVVDQRSNRTLAGGEAGGGAELAAERRGEVEAELERKVRAQVESIVGPGKARVSVHADLNLAQTTTQQETFDPDGQVVRSSQIAENTSANGLAAAGGGAASADANLPGGGGAGGTEQSSTAGTTETTNFEISKTVRTEVVEPGAIQRLTVAVNVDGLTAAGADGAPGEWQPRSEEDLQKIQEMVRAAVGFNEERGDLVTVTNLRFDQAAIPAGVEEKTGFMSKLGINNMMRGAELAVLLIVAALTIFFVARPLLKGIGGAGGGGMMDGLTSMPMVAAGPGGGVVLSGPSGPISSQLPFQQQAAGGGMGMSAPEPTIDIARIEGQVKASAVKQVSDFADRHPEESVSILRSWLHEG